MKKTLVALLVMVLLFQSTALLRAVQNQLSEGPVVSAEETTIIEMINQINESLLVEYHSGLLKFAPRYTGTITCNLAAEYLYNEFQEMGLQVEFHEWRYAGFQSKNVVATLPGIDPMSNAEFILCAHYDTTITSPGANDDGSGTAAVLAIASVLRHYQFNHTIRFITFSGEEVGTYGSFLYARDASYRGDNIVAVLNMDMIGYADTIEGGRVLRFFPPERSTWIADDATMIAEKYNDIIDMKVMTFPGYRGADNQAFVDYGYDGVWIAHQDGYPWGHSPNDTADRLNWSYYVKATKLMLAITVECTQKPIDVQVVLHRPYEGHMYVFNRPIRETSFGKQYFAGLRGITIILGGRTMARAVVFSQEPIQYVVFCIDGYFQFWDSEPPYEWTIQGWFLPIIGKHTLDVYVYTSSGKRASDEMDIVMFSLATSR
ncbi:MAG: Zn-dependent exopeptidase M28 [Candidatus Thermoplasmatota archaeon]|nr:Zn-dependent exopeptidase M28 [Candidatus Thermoplasmatota archaeon]